MTSDSDAIKALDFSGTETRLKELEAFASEVAEVLSEFGNGTTNEEIEALRDLAFKVASDWDAGSAGDNG